MKRQYLMTILVIVLCFGMLAGCASPEDVIAKIENGIATYDRSEKDWIKLAKAYGKLGDEVGARSALVQAMDRYPDSKELQKLMEEYLLPAPVPEQEPGSYEGALFLKFPANLHGDGELYITVNREEALRELYKDDSVTDDNLTIAELQPDDPDSFCARMLYQPGEYAVRAFAVKDGGQVSAAFEGIYTVTGTDFSAFTFAQEAGTYDMRTPLTFTGGEGKIYYTLDGSDPLKIVNGYLSWKGEKVEGGSLFLPSGNIPLTVRCESSDGIISPPIAGRYTMTAEFDTTSALVDEDAGYEFYYNAWKGLVRLDPITLEEATVLDTSGTERSLEGFSLFSETTTRDAEFGDDMAAAAHVMPGAAAVQWEETKDLPVAKTAISALVREWQWNSAVYLSYYTSITDNRRAEWKEMTASGISTRVGASWARYNGNVLWFDDSTEPQGTKGGGSLV